MTAAAAGRQLRVDGFREQFSEPEDAAAFLQSWLKLHDIGPDELIDVFHTAAPRPNRPETSDHDFLVLYTDPER